MERWRHTAQLCAFLLAIWIVLRVWHMARARKIRGVRLRRAGAGARHDDGNLDDDAPDLGCEFHGSKVPRFRRCLGCLRSRCVVSSTESPTAISPSSRISPKAPPPHGTLIALLQAGDRIFHLLARPRLAVDADAHVADLQDLAAGVVEVDVGDEQVGAAQARIGDVAERRRDLAPMLVGDDRDLALAALIGVADDALAGDDGGVRAGSIGPRCMRLIQICSSGSLKKYPVSGSQIARSRTKIVLEDALHGASEHW